MTEQDVINSQAFKALNLLIDQKAAELRGYMNGFKMRVDSMYEKPEYAAFIRVRIYDEAPKTQGVEVPLPVHTHQLKDLQNYLDTIVRLETEIGDLQRFKCRLTGDWDFTKGDTTEMEAVFGEKIEGM